MRANGFPLPRPETLDMRVWETQVDEEAYHMFNGSHIYRWDEVAVKPEYWCGKTAGLVLPQMRDVFGMY